MFNHLRDWLLPSPTDANASSLEGEAQFDSSSPSPTLFHRLEQHLNFFRIHLIAFTIIPLFFSGIFYGANGQFRIEYIDSLFLCFSAMTVTGLTTVNLSTLTGLQQAILFCLMILGDLTFVSWIMVLVRKNFFRIKCETLLRQDRSHRANLLAARTASRMATPTGARPFRTEVEDRPAPFSSETMHSLRSEHSERVAVSVEPGLSFVPEEPPSRKPTTGTARPSLLLHVASNEDVPPLDHSAQPTYDISPSLLLIDDTHLFDSPPPLSPRLLPSENEAHSPTFSDTQPIPSVPTPRFAQAARSSDHRQSSYLRHPTIASVSYPLHLPGSAAVQTSAERGLGGFPNPLLSLGNTVIPRGLRHRLTQPSRTMTLVSGTVDRREERLHAKKRGLEEEAKAGLTKAAKWLHFDGLLVGRNSLFANIDDLTDEELEEVGGVEYRALRLLSYLVAGYWIGSQLLSFLLIYPYLTTHSKWDSVFNDQPRIVSKPWFSAFQTLSAYTGGGLSLVDTSMIPFSTDYLMIFSLSFVILAGNHALPIFLRLIIWIGTKILPKDSEAVETLHFLLDHPRRCFLYLFPSHQTWYLFVLLLFFIVTEWIAFGVLNIGLEAVESLSVGQQIIDGFFQSICVRASGFQIVVLADLAPAIQFLYIILMYIAVFPIALSVRSTNVYEEKALGVFVREEGYTPDDPEPDSKGPRGEVFGRYLLWHARKQLAFDVWPLMLAIFLICIVERDQIMDDTNAPWFNLFRIVFEMVSAYATIGLTLGIPTQNYSFAGSFRPLSKLITICVMLRGRHRGLPQAIDRAIMLPREFKDSKRPPRQASAGGTSTHGGPTIPAQEVV
ncbi:cation transport protein-domain-containing protein [Mrakia frigida]|uniref:cation transport protein-domain-containing protein n=1 Tax=Mrakia frigida TaxID=29902 RepID=UPI003FCC0BAD